MLNEQQVRENLNEVLVPGIMRSLGALNLVREVTVTDGNVRRVKYREFEVRG